MADSDYVQTELQGNGAILKAVEYLRMLPEWKRKPGNLRTGHLEYSELIARYLINLYCTLEGKPLSEKIELDKSLNPLLQDLESKQAAMNEKLILDSHYSQLNTWHLDLSIATKGIERVVQDLEDEHMGAIGHVLSRRLTELVELCPFPKAA